MLRTQKKLVPAFKELMTLLWKKQINSRPLQCCGTRALIKETQNSIRAWLWLVKGFAEKVKPQGAFGLSYVGVGVALLGPPPCWVITHLVSCQDSAQRPHFHFVFPSLRSAWTSFPQPPVAHDTCLLTFHFSFGAPSPHEVFGLLILVCLVNTLME